MELKYKIAYYLRTDIQHIPPILPLYQELGGIIITKTQRIYDYLIDKYPACSDDIFLVKNGPEARKLLWQHDIKVVVYTGFQNLNWGYSVQVFHGVSDKNYIESKSLKFYDKLFLPGQKHYDKIKNAGYLQRPKRFEILGYPKFDKLVNETLDVTPLFNNGRKTILYAPTWISEKSNSGLNFSPYGESSLMRWGEKLIRAIAPHWNLIIKYHSRLNRNMPDIYELMDKTIIDVGAEKYVKTIWDADIIPYMHQSDLMISDISAVCYEWFHLDRPIVFANPSPEHYQPSADIFSNTYAWRAGDVLYKESEIGSVLEANLKEDKYKEIRNQLLNYSFYLPDGRAAERQVKALCELYEKVKNKNKAAMIVHAIFGNL